MIDPVDSLNRAAMTTVMSLLSPVRINIKYSGYCRNITLAGKHRKTNNP
jgi:hypothetical protein